MCPVFPSTRSNTTPALAALSDPRYQSITASIRWRTWRLVDGKRDS
jgi:hypothetical protein